MAERMGGDFSVRRLALDFMLLREPGVILGEEMAEGLARAFGTSAILWTRIDNAWQPAPPAG